MHSACVYTQYHSIIITWQLQVPTASSLGSLDVVTAIGAGMTVKFFPLFFKQDYGLNPGQIQLLFAVYGLSFGFFTWLCEKAAAKLGRVQARERRNRSCVKVRVQPLVLGFVKGHESQEGKKWPSHLKRSIIFAGSLMCCWGLPTRWLKT